MKDARIRFVRRTPFSTELRARVDSYFETTGNTQRDVPAMYRKTVAIFAWFFASLATVLIFGGSWPIALIGAVSLGLAGAGLGMAVQHDGGHKAVSKKKSVNRAYALVLDFLGSSAYIWNQKHNVMHHTYPNVVGSDDDIDIGFLARMAPEADRHSFHRFQHLYMWPLYAFITIKWHWIDDARALISGKIGDHPFPRPKGRDLRDFWIGKAIFATWALILPIAIQGVATGLLIYFTAQMVQGLVLAATFQLAHCVEKAAYFESPESGAVEVDFDAHQLATTVDFAMTSKVLTWYMGGLNYQAIHHVFPRISHIHYPALAPIVAEVAAKHGVAYKSTPSFWVALRSHYRWLRALGAPVESEAGVRIPMPMPSLDAEDTAPLAA